MKRIQRKRTKGWRMPENTVYVGRPSKWGNPIVSEDKRAATMLFRVCLLYPWYTFKIMEFDKALEVINHMSWIRDNIEQLRGKDLACWCKEGEPCHGDVLIEYLNEKL